MRKKYFSMMMAIAMGAFYSVAAQTYVNTLAELRTAVQQSNQTIILTPGDYNITVLPSNARYFPCSGSNNTIDLTGVYIDFPVGSSKDAHFQISGDNNTLKGGEFENTYNSGLKEVTDFVAYNDDKNNLAYGCDPHIVLTGDGNTIVGTKMTVRGSFPYGYGSHFGIGGTSVFGLSKRGGIAVQGPNNTIDSCELQMKAFGHGIYLQSAANNTVIKNTLVEGVVRPTNDILAEGQGSLPFQNDYKDNDGNDIQANEVSSLCEDGIRTYPGGGSVTVENCTVKKMRGGIRLYLEPNANVTNTIAIDCGNVNWNMPSSGTVTNSSGNFAYAPLSDFRLSRNNIEAEWTIIPSPHAIGSHNLADVLGNNHKLVFHRTPGPLDPETRAIVVSGDNSTITNETEYPIVLESSASGNTVVSCGPVIDNGSGNKITQNNCTFDAVSSIEAENYTAMSGVEVSPTTDEGAGDKVSAIEADDWTEYEVPIPLAGTYALDYRVSGVSEGDFKVELNGESVDSLSFEATGDDELWKTLRSESPIFFTQGLNTIRITAKSADWNLNWIKLYAECYQTPITPRLTTTDLQGYVSEMVEESEVSLLPGYSVHLNPDAVLGGSWTWTGPDGFSSNQREVSLDAIQKKQSGDYIVTLTNLCGVESKDTFSVNVQDSLYIEAESFTAMSGITVEEITEISGDSMLTSISTDDWMEYEINVPFTAIYRLDYRIASESDGEVEASVNSVIIDSIKFAATGGAQAWRTISSSSFMYLQQGTQTLRISSKTDGWNINYLQLNALKPVRECSLPYTSNGFNVRRETVDWSSGAMDISCETDVDIHVVIEGVGDFDASDYLHVYYKLDNGDLVPITEKAGAFGEMMISAKALVGKTVELIIQSQTADWSAQYIISKILIIKGSDPFARIQAEDYDENNGTKTETCKDTGGGLNVGSIEDGHWLKFTNLNMSEIHSINARLASRNSGGSIEVRLDSQTGKLIGSFDMPNTGNWQNWRTVSASLDSVVGFYDVYLVFRHPTSYVGNINWLEFSSTKIGIPSAISSVQSEQKTVLYPNPVYNNLTIIQHNGAQLEIYNQLGKLLLKETVDGDQHLVPMTNFQSGFYLLRLLNNGLATSYKVMKR